MEEMVVLRMKTVVVCGEEAADLCRRATAAYLLGDDDESFRLRELAVQSSEHFREAMHLAAKASLEHRSHRRAQG
jgi:hypothetical protein